MIKIIKKSFILLILTITFSVINACTYTNKDGFSYKREALGNNKYKIYAESAVEVNNYDQVYNLALKQAALTSIENNKPYFEIVSMQNLSEDYDMTTPIGYHASGYHDGEMFSGNTIRSGKSFELEKYKIIMTINLLSAPNNESFNAKEILNID